MVSQEAVGVDLQASLLAGFGQRLEKILSVHIVHVDILSAVSTAQDVINGSGIFDSELARHKGSVPILETLSIV